MRRNTIFAIIGLVSLTACASSLLAAPISIFNTRPVSVQAPTDPGPSLDTIVDGILLMNIDVINDQNPTAIWRMAAAPPTTIPALVAEWLCAGVDCSYGMYQEFGFFTAYDTEGPMTMVPIFLGNAISGADAAIQWLDEDTIQIAAPFFDPGINVGTFNGINVNWFGFYYKYDDGTAGQSDVTLYSYDLLNSPSGQTQAGMLAFTNGPAWAIAADYNAGPGGTLEYNDLVVKIESIVPAPEPSALIFLGTGIGLIGLLGRLRKKQ